MMTSDERGFIYFRNSESGKVSLLVLERYGVLCVGSSFNILVRQSLVLFQQIVSLNDLKLFGPPPKVVFMKECGDRYQEPVLLLKGSSKERKSQILCDLRTGTKRRMSKFLALAAYTRRVIYDSLLPLRSWKFAG